MTATPEEIVDGVWGISLGFVNAFVLVSDEVTLVDTGLARNVDQINGALRDIGRTNVDNIALTHHHPDHRGTASTFDARVFVHRLDADVVRGDREPPGPSGGGARKVLATALGPLVRLVGGEPKPTAVHREIEDGDEIPGTGGLRAVHTPGHTIGHVSFLHPGRRLLFVGDAAQNRTAPALPPPLYTEDMEQAKRTLAKIAQLDFDVAVFGHGKVLKGKANAEFRKLADRAAR